MNTQEFIQKIEDGDFETFQYGRRADFVVKDESGQAWMIEGVYYNDDDIVCDAVYDIKTSNMKPVKADPAFGIVGYKKSED